MKSVFTVLMILLTPTINPGDSIEIEIFITGYGKIEREKFFLQYSSEIYDKNNPGYMEISIGIATLENGTKRLITGEPFLSEDVAHKMLAERGLIGSLPETWFWDYPDDTRSMGEFGFPSIISEYTWDSHAPMYIKIPTDPKLKAGDYEISFIFTYSDGIDLGADKEKVIVHVNSWVERYSFYIAITAILVAILAIPYLDSISNFIWDLLKKTL